MEREKKLTYMVAVYLFLVKLRPLDPYMTPYLTGPDANATFSEVANEFELIKSYSALVVATVMLTTADYLLYKPNILFLSIWSSISFYSLTNSPSVTRLMVSMVGIKAIGSSSMLAFSYLYAQTQNRNHYQMATGTLMAAMQLGSLFGGISAQSIVIVTGGSYTVLPYCNAFTMFLALIWASFFPSVKREKYLSPGSSSDEKKPLLKHDSKNVKYSDDKIEYHSEYNMAPFSFKEIWLNLKTSYSNPIVRKRSIWYMLGEAAYILILNNINLLYSYVVNKPGNKDVLSNGYAESMVTLCGAAGAYLIGKLHLDWTYYTDIFTAFCSTIMGVLMMSCYFYDSLKFVYFSYILFGLVCQAHFVIIVAEIAKHLQNKYYSLVLVINYLGALILVSIMTLFLIQFNFMHITISGRFLFIGGIFIVLGIVFSFISILEFLKVVKTIVFKNRTHYIL